MACRHNHHHQSPACCCSHRYNTPHPPPPPPSSVDPIFLQSIVSQLLQNPQISHLYSAAPPAAAFSAAADLHPCSSQYPKHQNQKRPKQKQPQPHRQQFEDQFQDQYSVLASLLQRIDVLESSLDRFSSKTTSSLRHLAARTIQIHFRAHLVRRSRALRELKKLASIKSALNVLKSSLSLQKRIDFFSLSHEALDLIRQLETIQSGDQMVRDSKSSIRREIGRFLELVDEICVKRNTISVKTVKQIRIARNDDRSRVSNAGGECSGAYHRNKAPKQRNVDSGEKKLIDNLKERVERILHMSKALKDEDEDSADSDDGNGNGNDNGVIHRVSNAGRECSGAYHRSKAPKQRNVDNGEKKLIDNLKERVERIQHMSKALKDEDEDSADSDDGNGNDNGVIHGKIHNGRKHGVKSHGEKHVWFAEDGNPPTQVYDIHENEKVPVKRGYGNVERNERSVDEVESDIEQDDAESAESSELEDENEDQSGSLEGSSQCSEGEERRKVKPSHVCQDGKFILSAPPPVKMEGRMV